MKQIIFLMFIAFLSSCDGENGNEVMCTEESKRWEQVTCGGHCDRLPPGLSLETIDTCKRIRNVCYLPCYVE